MAIELYEFYKRCLIPLTPHPAVTKILKFVMAGGETTEDFVEVLTLDAELQHWARLTVQRMGRQVRTLDQVVTLLGQDRVRNMILGRYIERAFIPKEETLLEKARASTPEATKPESPANDKKGNTDQPQNDEKTEAAPENEEIESTETIPEIQDFKNYLNYANRAEEVAISIRNSYPGQAFAGGVIFDYLLQFLKIQDFSKIEEKSLTDRDQFINKLFEDGLRSAIAANSIVKKIVMKHQKIIFSSALLHNMGKALLLAYDPIAFEETFKSSTGARKGQTRIDSTDSELARFDFDHAQAGSLYFSRLSFFEDIEKAIDFHHHPYLLRFSNPNLYALSCALKVSGSLSKLYEAKKNSEPDPRKLPDQSLRAKEEFKFLKLNEKDWDAIKMDYASRLQSAGL